MISVSVKVLANFFLALSVFLSTAVISTAANSAEIYNTLRHLYVSDRSEPFFEVVSLSDEEVIERVETDYVIDDLVVSPVAPLLAYTNIQARKLVVYHLRERKKIAEFDLEFDPRQLVLDSTGLRLGISDSASGGFAMVSLRRQSLEIHIPDFPKTGDVLFDPNETDIYFSHDENGSLGILDINTREIYETSIIEIKEGEKAKFTSPSRSLDGRYVYIAEQNTGDVYVLNAYSKIIYQTFNLGLSPARPYTTPEGIFLYLFDKETGHFKSYQQHNFSEFADVHIGEDVDLATVGRFDRMNLFASTKNNNWYLFDNTLNKVVMEGQFKSIPIDAKGSVDGKRAYMAFEDVAEVAVIDLEGKRMSYIPATVNGAGSFSLSTNNVCH